MMNFQYEILNHGLNLTLTEKSKNLFKKSKETNLTISEWDRLSGFGQVEALGIIRLAEQERPEECKQLADDSGYYLSFNFIAELTDFHAQSLDLPQTFPFQIQIQTTGSIGIPSFSIRWAAFKRGRSITFGRKGCIVSAANENYRLPKNLFQVIECIEEYNAITGASFEQKTKFIAELLSMLPQQPDRELDFEGELANITLQHASAMSLQITGEKNSINFNPILFHKNKMEKIKENDEIIDESEQILSLNDARNFSAAFKNDDEVRATYLLGKANYIFIDEALRPALRVVKNATKFSLKDRIEFAKSPQKYIKSALESSLSNLPDIDREIQSLLIDQIFIETNQFSERIIEMGIWKAPDLPWLQTEPNEWRDDHYSFFVQGKIISFPNGQLEGVIEQLESALKNGKPKCVVGGVEITPDHNFLNTLKGLIPVTPSTSPPSDGSSEDSSPKNTDPEDDTGPIVPLTKGNFEVIEYNKKFTIRKETLTPEPPECLNPNITLKDHQKIGISWLVETYNRGFPGVLMADDMGLGKTLQALAFLAIMVETGKTDHGAPLLIVAPVGLLKNWEEEHEKHLTSPGLGDFGKLYGNSLKQFKIGKGRDIDTGSAVLDIEKIKRYNWLLTTYETLRDYQASFAQIKFSCVVFDEIQKVKNPRALISNGAKVLNAAFSIGLTGTPVENSLADLWAVIDTLSPGRLGDLKGFIKKYPEPDSSAPEAGIAKLRSLSKQLLEKSPNGPPPVLRRMKSELKDSGLPEKHLIPSAETTMQMPTIQEEAYQAVSNALNSGSIQMLDAIHRFRARSRSPIPPEQLHEFSIDDFINTSARLQATFSTLDDIYKRGEKVLLFVESRNLQPALASMIKQKYKMRSQPLIINGAITGDARQRHVNEFQNSPSGFNAIIISPKAGGVGITLTAANNVIHVERWWNPAVEDQCTDRAYRIGQTKPVKVFTPISRSISFGDKSFDCILDRLLDKKRNLATGVFMPTTISSDDFSNAFGQNDSGKLLTLDEVDCLESGIDFENAVIEYIRASGLKASRTQASYDWGADIIVENETTKKSAIIQCKHKANFEKSIDDSAAVEVLKSTQHYSLISPILCVATNAQSATRKCVQACKSDDVLLILRGDLLQIGKILNKHLL